MKKTLRALADQRWWCWSMPASWFASMLALGVLAQEPVTLPVPTEQSGVEAITASVAKLEEMVAKAEKLVEGGDVAAARESCQAALQFAEGEWDQPRWLAAADKVLWRLGLAATGPRDWRTARDAWRAVHRHREATLPDEHPELQWARANLAATMSELGDLRGARALDEQVLAVYTKTLPAEHPDLQAIRGNVAATMFRLGDLTGARALFEQVLAVCTKTLPAEHMDLQTARGNVAATMFRLGDLTGARALFEQVLAVYTKALPAGHPDLQMARVNVAATMFDLGDLAGARGLQEQVLAVYAKTLPAEHPDLQVARANLAAMMKAFGDLAGARGLQEQVLAVRTKTLPAEHMELQQARLNLASTMSDLGDLRGARELQEQVLAVLTKTLPEQNLALQRARHNLAGTMSQLGDLVGARGLQEQVLAVRTKTLPAEHPDLQLARLNFALTIKALGDPADARALQEQVLAVFSKTLPDEHPHLQLTRLYLARTSKALGDVRAAARLNRAAVAGALRRLSFHPVAMRGAAELARSVATPISHLNSLLDLGDQLPSELAADLRRDALHLLEATRSVELQTARLRHAVQTARPEAFARLAPQIAAASLGLENAIALPPEGRITPDGKTIARDDAIRDATFARDALERELLELIPESLRRAISPTDLAASLAPQEAAVSFVTYTRWTNDAAKPWMEHSEQRFGAYVLTRDNTISWHSLAPVADIETLIAAIRSDALAGQQLAVRSPTSSADAAPGRDPDEASAKPATLTKNLLELRTRLFDPILQALPEGTKSLTLSLANELHLVPLDELPLASSTSLGEAFDLRTVWSLRALLEPRAARSASPTALVLGGPDYDKEPEDAAPVLPEAATPIVATTDATRSNEGGHTFVPLPGAKAEAEQLAATFAAAFADRSATTLFDAAASEAWFVEAAPGKTFLHLATHGYFAPEQAWVATDHKDASPLARFDTGRENRGAQLSPYSLAGLAFAGANLPADELGRREGILTAQEVVHLDLAACELATLSACKTSLGVRRAGAGLASLRQAFHAAGARYVLATLWEVSDVEAQKLMTDFYDHLWKKGQDAREALKAAKAAARLRGVAFRDWAGWTLSGR